MIVNKEPLGFGPRVEQKKEPLSALADHDKHRINHHSIIQLTVKMSGRLISSENIC